MLHHRTCAAVAIVLIMLFSSSPLNSQDRGQLRTLAAKLCETGRTEQKLDAFATLKWELPARMLGPFELKLLVAPANDCRDGAPIADRAFRMLFARITQVADRKGQVGIYETFATSLRGELIQAYRFEFTPDCKSNCLINYPIQSNSNIRAQFEQEKAFWLARYGLPRN